MGGTANETRRDGRDSGRRAAGLLLLLLAAGLLLAACAQARTYLTAGTLNRGWQPIYRDFDGLPMVYVPAGCFVAGRIDGPSEEQPGRRVCLGGFWIGQTEITNAQYAACVEAEACTPPVNPVYFDAPRYANHPVVHITWDQAAAYAAWRGGALPSEFQWEYAARGTEGAVYPWGYAEPDCQRANYGTCVRATAAVGPDQRTMGASWVGALDLAGNVEEWTASWYGERLYFQLEDGAIDPAGPTDGRLRVLRGGAWGDAADQLRATVRARHTPVSHSDTRGFRIILNAPRE